jgi:hypothetical protein
MSFEGIAKSIRRCWRGVSQVRGCVVLPPRSLIVWMSFGWLFLGGLLSSRARLRFTNQVSMLHAFTLENRIPANGNQ